MVAPRGWTAAPKPRTVIGFATHRAGLRSLVDGLPGPANPVGALVESLWLAVRQSQFPHNRQPAGGATTSGSVPGAATTAVVPDLGGLLSRDGVEVTLNSTGAAGVIDGRFTDQVVTSAGDAASVLNAVAPALGLATGFADSSAIAVSSAGTGATAENFYRLTETVDGIDVLGSDVVLVTDADGRVTSLFNNYLGLPPTFDVIPDASVDQQKEIRRIAAVAYLGPAASRYAVRRFEARTTFTEQLVIDALDDAAVPTLAWRVVVELPDNGDMSSSGAAYLIDADGSDAGHILVTVSNAEPYTATTIAKDWLGNRRVITIDTQNKSWYTVYGLVDANRDITTYQTRYAFFGTGRPVLPGGVVHRGWFGWNAEAVSAHANTAKVYDYYSDVLGRNSYDGQGAAVDVSIRYNPRTSDAGYANAFWDPARQQFVFGDAGHLDASVDVIGHEYTHAVISWILNPAYGGSVLDYGQSGALNEAMADIMGMLIEGKSGTDKWLLGEDSGLGAVRNLADPASTDSGLGPYRDNMDDYYTGSADDHGEHVNSTIFSHAAYLMMTDPATADISDETWARVFYQSIPRLSLGAQFTDGRAAVLSSARALGFTTPQLAAIGNAFDDVGIVAGATASTVAV
ncbi:Zinc metalloprotease (elastase) [Mycolicibacterium chubuense NBB4]|uniref:Neutral metalloproteinase n=1 Tax=Mycolicibacterium chubuense (strain NBB4) TaxID=710421 RepID=I4BL97_MYCCN|nr:Zinc metalloprotease (elastase) [Mycolicibacterium chubuense NBB4]